MLWLCLHLPLLPLEVFTRGALAPGPLAVAEDHGTRRTVCLASPEAEAAGVRAGMDLAAAQALAPELAVRGRDDTAEAQALAAVASWAGQFTPAVSLTASGALLEVAGSLGLFGGAEGLFARVEEGLGTLGYRADLPLADLLAPPPGSPLALADQFHRARRVLPNRPLTALDWRKRLIDLPGVKNAWVMPVEVPPLHADLVRRELVRTPPRHGRSREVRIGGLYRVAIDFMDVVNTEAERKPVVRTNHEPRA
jgi:hypothetical protein